MLKRVVFSGFLLLLSAPAACHADAYLLKSGQTIRGKLLEKTEDKYVVRVDGSGETLEIPVSQVSIADIDPDSKALPRGTLSVVADAGRPGERRAQRENVKVVALPPPSEEMPEVPQLGKGGILKLAQDTVALSNQRTAQSVEEINKMKAIADAANPE